MAQSRDKPPGKPKAEKERVLLEEQGDLLGEAVSEILLWDLAEEVCEEQEEEMDSGVSEGESVGGASKEEAEGEPEEGAGEGLPRSSARGDPGHSGVVCGPPRVG